MQLTIVSGPLYQVTGYQLRVGNILVPTWYDMDPETYVESGARPQQQQQQQQYMISILRY